LRFRTIHQVFSQIKDKCCFTFNLTIIIGGAVSSPGRRVTSGKSGDLQISVTLPPEKKGARKPVLATERVVEAEEDEEDGELEDEEDDVVNDKEKALGQFAIHFY